MAVIDRRRINGPIGRTTLPVYAPVVNQKLERPFRSRESNELRKTFLKTNLIPAASGSAYLELSTSAAHSKGSVSLANPISSLKLLCAIHGPKPLPRSSPFAPHMLLSTYVKFATFASRQRRGYIRDCSERDLGAQLETALRGVVIAEKWPKSGVDVIITVIEAEDDQWAADESAGGSTGWAMMSILSGCITVAAAALADARVDCIDLISGGCAAVVKCSNQTPDEEESTNIMLDPSPPEHKEILAACTVGYLHERDEIVEFWMKGDSGVEVEELVNKAVGAAIGSRSVLAEALKEDFEFKFGHQSINHEHEGFIDT